MSGPDVNNLFPAIAQSFVIILIGYLFGRFNIIPSSEARSIGVLVGKLALPALLFQNLAILDLTAISWPFMGGILIAKFAVFVIVAVITVVITRPFSLGKGGLFGIFATQSNDFALGLPIGKLSGSDCSQSAKYFLPVIDVVLVTSTGRCQCIVLSNQFLDTTYNILSCQLSVQCTC